MHATLFCLVSSAQPATACGKHGVAGRTSDTVFGPVWPLRRSLYRGPSSRTEDRTFQLTFLLPSIKTGISTQSHKLPRAKTKPKSKQQRVKTPKVNTEPTQEGLETRRVYDRARSQTPKRKAYKQEYRRKYTRQKIEQGLCRDCRKPAIEGQTRCETCRDKHRASCRRSSQRPKG